MTIHPNNRMPRSCCGQRWLPPNFPSYMFLQFTLTLCPLRLGVYCPPLEIRQAFITFNQQSAIGVRLCDFWGWIIKGYYTASSLLEGLLALEAFRCHLSTDCPETLWCGEAQTGPHRETQEATGDVQTAFGCFIPYSLPQLWPLSDRSSMRHPRQAFTKLLTRRDHGK